MSQSSAGHTGAGWSLQSRVLAFGMLTVAAFMLFTGFALEQTFRGTVIAASQERLQSRIFLVMGRTELDAAGIPAVTEPLPEPDLELPNSGAIAAISDRDGAVLWRSASSIGELPVPPSPVQPGRVTQAIWNLSDSEAMRALSYPVMWEYGNGKETYLVFHAAEPARRVTAEIAIFRDSLKLWLGGAAVLVLVLQIVMLKWLMQPLRAVSQELVEIEAGRRSNLQLRYPSELLPLISNLNGLLTLNRMRLQRYRNGLADLAHSLKTPLAVIRASGEHEDRHRIIEEQTARMEQTIQYQLQKAASAGRTPLATNVALAPVAIRVVESLAKVYRSKKLTFECSIAPDVIFPGDADDLMEILGNLGDNACKWARSRVTISAAQTKPNNSGLSLCIEDDGPGVAADLREQVLLRGVRADTRLPGQGLGLAMTREIVVELYHGEIMISDSSLGGARVCCRFP